MDAATSIDPSATRENDSFLHDLPFDPLLHVLSYLKAWDVDHIRGVSRALKGVVDDRRSWLPLYRGAIEVKDAHGRLVFDLLRNRSSDWFDVQGIRLPYNDISDLMQALVENSSGVFPAPMYPHLQPSILLKELRLGGQHVMLDSNIAAFNEVLPPFTSIIFMDADLRTVSFATLKAVVAQRTLRFFESCILPRWEANDDVRPVSANRITMRCWRIHADNQNFLRALMSLSTRVDCRFRSKRPSRAEKDLMTNLAKTAETLRLYIGPSDYILPLLAGIPHLVCRAGSSTKWLSTRGIRELIQAYLESGRVAFASISITGATLATFSPLRNGFIENTVATEEEQLKRNNTCLNGDTFLFKNRLLYVQVTCTERIFHVDNYEFAIVSVRTPRR